MMINDNFVWESLTVAEMSVALFARNPTYPKTVFILRDDLNFKADRS
jgi:hypothetical protein